jgi:hypothetical protein
VGDKTLEWGFPISQQGRVRFTIKLNEKGEWFEVGEMTQDGNGRNSARRVAAIRMRRSRPALRFRRQSLSFAFGGSATSQHITIMKKRIGIIGITLLGLISIFVTVHIFTTSSTVAVRPVRLVVTGPEGQHFSGSYIADGITNAVSAIAPATITTQARDVIFEFKREGGDGEFRVALYVGELCRISTTSYKGQGVRGVLRYASNRESYWAAWF